MKKNELKKLEVSTFQKLREAIEKGEKEEAIARLAELREGDTKLRNALVDWIDTLLIFISEKLGEKAIEEAVRTFFQRGDLRAFLGAELGELNAEERMKRRANVLTGVHNRDITAEEDDEKFTLKWSCHTGGRVVSKGNFGKTSRPYPWSNSQMGIAYYCAHCIIGYEMMFMEQFGFPNFIVIPPRKEGDLCTQYMYKEFQKIPESYLQMFRK